ncbi:protein SOSEKI 2 [Malania oleifera]|uniref:protein SOSEKI 2 n=1 Tax=Malania oleifera TaxID=397392 RepID=UPI0025ADAA29|nr:protein SOSEKI 2 [Malania oleifera]
MRMEVRGIRRNRETSPDRARVVHHRRLQQQPSSRVVNPFRKVQVVYYLTRNGQLEHPHYMEVSHLASQQLRLKDVMDRLTVLRGKGMPSLYSWSCKRSYKNGYVWNDLAENDVIYPVEGAEYVLKGSEIIQGCTERFQQLQVSNRHQIPEPTFHLKIKPPPATRNPEADADNTRYRAQFEDDDEEEEEDEYEEEKTSYTSSNTPLSRCSRGVSTDEALMEEPRQPQPAALTGKKPTELTLETESPPSTSSTNSDKANNEPNTGSKRFDGGDLVTGEPTLGRNSMLLQLIACGSSVAGKAKMVPGVKRPPCAAARKSESRRREAAEEEMIGCMSVNPRFGNLQAAEKEYFSGSIVETMMEERGMDQPELKKSSSYNEERSSKARLEPAVAAEENEEKKLEKAVKGKCIPRKKSSSSSSSSSSAPYSSKQNKK